jgi:hypothetical protein
VGVVATEDLPNSLLECGLFAVEECKCLKSAWDDTRFLCVPSVERAVFEGGLLGKNEISCC